ncbi:MAG: PAS domain S-box protein [Phycisphaeraceae bacterium]|nr:PAS domain S-box protein [Phycisphaeraceae bacterium]
MPDRWDVTWLLAANLCYVLAVAYVQGLVNFYDRHLPRWGRGIYSGIWFGAMTLASMMAGIEVTKGIWLDGRLLMLALAGLFGGWQAGLTAAAMAGIYRFSYGGSGLAVGMGAIVSAVFLGWVVRQIKPALVDSSRWRDLGWLGMLLWGMSVAWTYGFPGHIGYEYRQACLWPMGVFYLVATPMLGGFFLLETRRAKADAAQRDNHRRLLYALEHGVDGLWDWDAASGKLFLSPRYKTMLGYTPHEIADNWQNAWHDLVHPDDQPKEREIARAHFAGKSEIYEAEYRMRNKAGGWQWILSRGRMMEREENGRARRWIGTHTDITKRKLAEQEIRRQRDLAQMYLDLAAVIFVVLDTDGRVILLNRLGGEVLGVTTAEAEGRPWTASFVAPEDQPRVHQLCTRMFSGQEQETVSCEAQIVRQDGTRRQIEWHMAALRDEEGGVRGVIGSGLDVTEKRAAEYALQDSEKRYRTVIESSRSVIVCLQPDLTISEWNPAMERLTGWTRAEALGKDFGALVAPEEFRARLPAQIGWLLEGKAMENAEMPVLTRDGRQRFMLWSVTRLTDQAGRAVGVAGIGHDITEIKETQDALRESKLRLDQAIEGTNSVFWDLHYPTGRRMFGPRYKELLGYEPDDPVDVAGIPWHQLLHPDDFEPELKIARAHLEGKTPHYEAEVRFKGKGGRWIWVQIRGKIVERREDNRPIRWIGTITDVTRRKLAEQALRESEQRYRGVVEATGDLILRLDMKARLTFANQAFCRMFSQPRDAILGKPITIQLHENERAAAVEAWTKVLRPPFRSAAEVRLSTALGWRWFAWDLTGIVGEQGQLQEVQAVGRDTTERQQVEAAMRRRLLALAQVARLNTVGAMASSFAHELRQPLTAIINFASGAMRRFESAEAAAHATEGLPGGAPGGTAGALGVPEAMQHIVTQAKRANAILSRVRDFVGQRETATSQVEINQVVEQAAALIRPEAQRTRVRIELNLGAGLPVIEAEARQIEQVLVNLMLNAIEAMVDGGGEENRLTARTQCADGQLEVEIADTGPGIRPEEREQVFEPFHTTKSQGMGLGLSISRSIIQAHGGRMWVENGEQGGARFHFTLPVPPEKK